MTTNNRLLALAVAAVLVGSAPSAHATLAAAATFDEKVENASSIVLGKCIKTESRQDPTGRWILTYSTFTIEKTIKGNPATEITIVTPGGQVGTTRQDTIGIPQFRTGDEQVLFVKDSRVGPTVLYFDQGAYDDAVDDRGEKIVAPIQSTLVKIDTQRGFAVPAELPRRLKDFQDDVAVSVRGARQRQMQFEMIQSKQQQKQATIGSVLLRYKWIIGIALLGAAVATWQLLRSR